jgi:TetR/AcrR family transcriptional repressor of nem operon
MSSGPLTLDDRTVQSYFPLVKGRKVMILDAAARLISQKGFRQTSVDDVIEAAELSGKSHFYHYFSSKEELGYAVLERQFERFADRGLAMLSEPMIDPLERLALFIDTVAALQGEGDARGGSPFGVLATEMADSHEGFRVRFDSVFDRWTAQIKALLVEARPQLRDGVDETRLATFIIVTLEGALLMTRIKREGRVMQAIAADLKSFIAMHTRQGTRELTRPIASVPADVARSSLPA